MGRRREYEIEDDRDDAERRTHRHLVAGRDSFLSGWGGAEGGASIAAWACEPGDADRVFRWVKGRSDMRRVKLLDERAGFGGFVLWRAHYAGLRHVHIYVVNAGHPALREG